MLIESNFDMPKFVALFIAYLKRMNRSPETIKGYEKDLKRFQDFLFVEYNGYLLTEEIKKEDILKFWMLIEKRGLKITSICRYLSSIKSFCKYLVKERDFKVDIGASITLPKAYVPLPNILNEDEMQHFLESAKKISKTHYALSSTLYYTGSRLTPVRTLLKSNVNLKDKQIYFPQVKRGKDLYLPLHEKLGEVLEEYLFDSRFNGSEYVFPSSQFINRPIGATYVRLYLKEIAEEAGFERRITPHFIRHCTATHLTIAGTDQKALADILGQTDIRSTTRYQHLNVNNLRPSINKLK